MDLKQKTLMEMSEGELQEIAKALRLDVDADTSRDELIKCIVDSNLYNPVKETGTIKPKRDAKGRKVHPQLGRYYKVIVHPTRDVDRKTSVFASINSYVAEFQPGEPVELPAAIIKFLKKSGYPKHYFDPHAISENGNMGAHKTRYEPRYIIERVDEEL